MLLFEKQLLGVGLLSRERIGLTVGTHLFAHHPHLYALVVEVVLARQFPHHIACVEVLNTNRAGELLVEHLIFVCDLDLLSVAQKLSVGQTCRDSINLSQ